MSLRGCRNGRRTTSPAEHRTGGHGAIAVAVVLLMLLSSFGLVQGASEDSDATASDSWACRITVDGTTLATEYKTGDGSFQPMTAAKGFGEGKTEGGWAYNRATGYGPFGSFYAAFDPAQSNKMVCHLNPYNLKEALGGGTSVKVDGVTVEISECNIMWCLPKIYLSIEDDGKAIVLASDESWGGELAPAFTVGGKDYNYLALGVYEATYDGGKLGSVSGTSPKSDISLEDYRSAAKANNMTDGTMALLWNFYQWQLYRLCSLAIMEDFDSQAQVGYGNSSSYVRNFSQTGTMNAEGPYYGTAEQNADGAKLFIENAWGSLDEYVDDAVWYDGLWAGQSEDPKYAWNDETGNKEGKKLVYPYAFWGWGTTPSADIDIWGLPTEKCTDADEEGTSAAPDCVYGSTTSLVFCVGGDCNSGDRAGISYMCYAGGGGSQYGIGSRLAFMFTEDASTISAPEVEYDHSDLKVLLKEYGYSEGLADALPPKAEGTERYDALEDVAEFRHIGWIVDGVQYPADSVFVKRTDHTARSVWVGLPAVTYDHSRLIEATGDHGSVAGLSNGLEIEGNYNYEQLPARNGYTHVGWLIGDVEVGPTDPFVTRNSHTAVSLWATTPMAVLDHHELTDMTGDGAEGVSALPLTLIIADNAGYVQLPDTAGYRHIGWRIGDATVGPTAGFVAAGTHTAVSLWEKMTDNGFVPMPDDGRWDDGVYIPVQEESGHGWLGDSKNILIIAIIAAIIAELAVLAYSRRH